MLRLGRQQEAREARHHGERQHVGGQHAEHDGDGERDEQEARHAEQQHDREEHDADRQRRDGQRLDHLVAAVEDRHASAACPATGCGGCSRSSTVALSTSRPIASARPPSVIRLIVLPVRNRPTMPAKIDSGIDVRDDHRVAPAAQEHQDHQRDQDRRDDRLADHVLHRGAHEHRLVEVELQLQPVRRRGLDLAAARRAPRRPRPASRRRRASGSPGRPRACR